MERVGSGRGRPERRTFARGTNNEAEYLALIAGLRTLLGRLPSEGLAPAQISLEVRGDSQLVIRQLEGAWKTKEPRLRDLRDEAEALLARFGAVHYRHQPRSRSVAALGH